VYLHKPHKYSSNNFENREDVPNQFLQKPSLDIPKNPPKTILGHPLKSSKNHARISLKILQKIMLGYP
jgi:hypothetical protein